MRVWFYTCLAFIIFEFNYVDWRLGVITSISFNTMKGNWNILQFKIYNNSKRSFSFLLLSPNLNNWLKSNEKNFSFKSSFFQNLDLNTVLNPFPLSSLVNCWIIRTFHGLFRTCFSFSSRILFSFFCLSIASFSVLFCSQGIRQKLKNYVINNILKVWRFQLN